MKFIISSTALLKQISALSGVIVSNPVVPILENFLFEIKDNTLTITASDLQTSMVAEMSVESEMNGSIAVPAKMLADTLRNLPEQPVTFTINPDTYIIELNSENGHYKLAGENAADFPRVPEAKNAETVELTAEVLSSAIAYTLFATSTDEMKPNMNGVYINLRNTDATFVSTDSHRLVRYRRFDVSSPTEVAVIIPRKALGLLKNTLPSDNTPLQLALSKSNAFISFANIRMVCRLIDERFPDYEYVIPVNNDKVLEIDRAELLGSLKRIAIYANKSTNQVRLKINPDSLEVYAEDIDFSNEGEEKLPCVYEGETMEIGFNAKFLIEGLSNLNSKKVVFKLSEPNRAGLLAPETTDESEDILMLIMPVMLNSYY
ncbi:DNA polymerase III subunit beta [Rhodoflexus caldus]|uniref:DNA polymerase III subunit beta n=1 Tax=Rhodoflexus caldus TaxID=2891236 RepID=UPI00202AACB9|nr:DNA polymerase III subunit beta [Rhodoflexus caldus]